jgi:glycosyltransferase involved in cell wall biosynthesis
LNAPRMRRHAVDAAEMKILLATGRPYLPQFVGGAQANTHHIALALKTRGHDVAVTAALGGNGLVALRNRVLMKSLRRRVISDGWYGYRVYRSWFPWQTLREVIASVRPDVVFVQQGFALRFVRPSDEMGVPVVFYLHDIEYHDLGDDPSNFAGRRCIANSNFTAARYRNDFGVSCAVVPPFFDRRSYAPETTREWVTFVNPHPCKGSAIALDVAERCPDIPFAFVESWPLDDDVRDALNARLKKLRNVKLFPRWQKMKPVYARTRIVLAPSQWEEAWGRIASEAHFAGIPVVASNSGGLPESVGPGGILIARDAPIAEWVNAVRGLWSDENRWRAMSDAARRYSSRDALSPARQIEEIEAVLLQATRQNASRPLLQPNASPVLSS